MLERVLGVLSPIVDVVRVAMAATRFFLPGLKGRVGKCIMFGVKDDQTQYAAQISRLLSERWKGIVVGEEGYVPKDGLTDKVRWGEMVSNTPRIGMQERSRCMEAELKY